jgi:hypothetical protein
MDCKTKNGNSAYKVERAHSTISASFFGVAKTMIWSNNYPHDSCNVSVCPAPVPVSLGPAAVIS